MPTVERDATANDLVGMMSLSLRNLSQCLPLSAQQPNDAVPGQGIVEHKQGCEHGGDHGATRQGVGLDTPAEDSEFNDKPEPP